MMDVLMLELAGADAAAEYATVEYVEAQIAMLLSYLKGV